MTGLNQCPPQAIIEELTRRRLTHQPGSALEITPQSAEQAFSWQQAVALHMASLGKPILGWKCALPVEGRWGLAPIYQLNTGASCPIPQHNATAQVEPEYAWRLKRDLLPKRQPLDRASLQDAVQCHLALEIINNRFTTAVDFYSRFADGLLNHSVWLGPELANAPAQIPLRWHSENEHFSVVGSHPSLDTFAPLEWLVAFLHQRNIGLYTGQIIITGSLNGLWNLPVNQPVQIEYAEQAAVVVEFIPLAALI